MSNKRHRNKFSKTQIREALEAKPLGYLRLEDHAKTVSVLRYYTQEELDEIKTVAKRANDECNHTTLPGKCMVLYQSNEREWREWH